MSRVVWVGLLVLLGALRAGAQEFPAPSEERVAMVRLPLAAVADLVEVRRAVALAIAEDGRRCSGDVRLALRWDPVEPGELEAFGTCRVEAMP